MKFLYTLPAILCTAVAAPANVAGRGLFDLSSLKLPSLSVQINSICNTSTPVVDEIVGSLDSLTNIVQTITGGLSAAMPEADLADHVSKAVELSSNAVDQMVKVSCMTAPQIARVAEGATSVVTGIVSLISHPNVSQLDASGSGNDLMGQISKSLNQVVSVIGGLLESSPLGSTLTPIITIVQGMISQGTGLLRGILGSGSGSL